MLRDTAYLLDILREAQLAQEFASGIERETLDTDLLRQYAIVRCITVIGEATRRVSEEFREAHPQIVWHGMIGMRNRLIHEYNRVDLDLVWNVLQQHIPALIALIEPLIPSEDDLDAQEADD